MSTFERQANATPAPARVAAVDATGHISWVAGSKLSLTWLPAHFEPRFVAMETSLASNPRAYIRLGDLVDVASLWPTGDTGVDWRISRKGESLSIEPAGEAQERLVKLPDECIVFHPLVFRGGVATTFWSAAILGGVGGTGSASYALVSRTTEDVAWLNEALADPVVALQFERASAGGVIPLLRRGDLLDVRVPVMALDERLRVSQRVRARLTRSHSTTVPKYHVLTGATHEERLQQFERILFEEAFAVPGSGFHVQAIGREGDRWVIRPLGQVSGQGATLTLTSDATSWRDWYWSTAAFTESTVLNSLQGPEHVPDALLAEITTTSAPDERGSATARLPSFVDFMAAVESARDEELDQDAALEEVARLWESINPGLPLTEDGFAWLRRVFRPILALRVLRAGKVDGAYLLVGPDQLDRPAEVASFLVLQGEQLATMLDQPSEIAEDAARRESIRRLSWMMHQLNGPMMVVRNVIEELTAFVDANEEVASHLLPDAKRAQARAEMTGKPLDDFRVGHRLLDLANATESIRRLQYQIRQYKNAQGELQITSFAVRSLLNHLVDEARHQLDEGSIDVEAPADLQASGDLALIHAALSEVISNACRECRERRVTQPQVMLSAGLRGERVRIAVRDNALPTDGALLIDPFAEDASTYRLQGKGSGLGLAIVKETFARHGGQCSLTPNVGSAGARLPGVQFVTDIAAAVAGSVPQGVPHV